MPDRTEDPVNPIKWHVRLTAALVIAILTVALVAANEGWLG